MRSIILTALLLAFACKGSAPHDRGGAAGSAAPASADAAPQPDAAASAAASVPRLEARAATATFDAATRTLHLAAVAGVDVHDASGALVHTATPAELAQIHDDAVAKRPSPTVRTTVTLIATDAAGRPHTSQHVLEAIRHDDARATTALVLAPGPALATIPATLTDPAVVMGPVPLHIVCCDCDWACIAGWAFGYCSTCISGTVGASSCCAVCGIPANSSQTCP